MLFLSIFLLIIIVLIIMLFTFVLKIDFILDTNREIMNISMLWLYPFLKANIFMEQKVPTLEVFIFKMKLFRKNLNNKKKVKSKKGFKMQDIKFQNINLTTHYGFQDKFLVGIVCGFINIASQFFQINYLEQEPDFLASNDYIYLRATASINIMPTIKSLASH